MTVPISGSFSMFGILNSATIAGAIYSHGGAVSGIDNFEQLLPQSVASYYDPTYAGTITNPSVDVFNTEQFRNYPVATATPTPTPIPPTATPTPTPTPSCTCWTFENIGASVANVSYDGCSIGSAQTNVDIGDTICKCITYGTTPYTNSGTVDISPTSINCDGDYDCIDCTGGI